MEEDKVCAQRSTTTKAKQCGEAAAPASAPAPSTPAPHSRRDAGAKGGGCRQRRVKRGWQRFVFKLSCIDDSSIRSPIGEAVALDGSFLQMRSDDQLDKRGLDYRAHAHAPARSNAPSHIEAHVCSDTDEVTSDDSKIALGNNLHKTSVCARAVTPSFRTMLGRRLRGRTMPPRTSSLNEPICDVSALSPPRPDARIRQAAGRCCAPPVASNCDLHPATTNKHCCTPPISPNLARHFPPTDCRTASHDRASRSASRSMSRSCSGSGSGSVGHSREPNASNCHLANANANANATNASSVACQTDGDAPPRVVRTTSGQTCCNTRQHTSRHDATPPMTRPHPHPHPHPHPSTCTGLGPATTAYDRHAWRKSNMSHSSSSRSVQLEAAAAVHVATGSIDQRNSRTALVCTRCACEQSTACCRQAPCDCLTRRCVYSCAHVHACANCARSSTTTTTTTGTAGFAHAHRPCGACVSHSHHCDVSASHSHSHSHPRADALNSIQHVQQEQYDNLPVSALRASPAPVPAPAPSCGGGAQFQAACTLSHLNLTTGRDGNDDYDDDALSVYSPLAPDPDNTCLRSPDTTACCAERTDRSDADDHSVSLANDNFAFARTNDPNASHDYRHSQNAAVSLRGRADAGSGTNVAPHLHSYAGAGTSGTLPNMGSKRRESFLYRDDLTEREPRARRSSSTSQPSVPLVPPAMGDSAPPQPNVTVTTLEDKPHAAASNDMRLLDEPIVTPFAQILATLHSVRAKYTVIAHLPPKRAHKFRNVHSSIEENANESQQENDNENENERHSSQRQAAADVLEDLDWCLDQLETVQAHRSLSDLASSKFKRMLKKELSQLTEAGQTGSQVADYISNTYTDKQQEDIESNSPNADDATRMKSNGSGFRNNESRRQAEAADKEDVHSSGEVTEVLITAPQMDGALHMSTIATVESGTGSLANKDAVAALSPTSEDVKNQNTFVKPFVGRLAASLEAAKRCRLVDGKPRFSNWNDEKEREIDEALSVVNDWGIDVFRLHTITDGHPLVMMVFSVLETRNLLGRLKINPHTLLKYLVVVEGHYHQDIPYHTSIHAADVTQSTHVMLSASRFQNVFSDLEVFAAVMASAIHDTDHPGVTNQFLINTSSDLATMYNDESVLENHHLAVSFKIMQDSDLDFLLGHSSKVRSQFRRLVIDMVLATDMSKHMALLADLKTMVESKIVSRQNSESTSLTLETYCDKILIMKNLIHCADLSNPAKPLPIYQVWVDRIMEEFFRQGDLERSKGIDISPMCDRLTATVEKSQVGFIDFIVHPLWETWAELVYPDCQPMLDLLAENREWYKQRTA